MSERLEELQGTVADTVFRNDDNGWSVIEVRAQGDIITVVGALPALSTGETCLFGGEWAHHPPGALGTPEQGPRRTGFA